MSCLYTTEQPPHWDHLAQDGAYFNRLYLKDAGLLVPQHSHTEAHTTLLVQGKLRAWREDELLGDFEGPAAIFIQAKIKHTFQSLEPDTLAFCIFSKAPVQHEEHQFGGPSTQVNGKL